VFSDLGATQFVCMDWIPLNRFLQLVLLLALPLNKNGPPRSALSNFSTAVWESQQCCWLYHMLSLSHLLSVNPFFRSSLKMPLTCIKTQPEVYYKYCILYNTWTIWYTYMQPSVNIYSFIFCNISSVFSGYFITIYSQIRTLSYSVKLNLIVHLIHFQW